MNGSVDTSERRNNNETIYNKVIREAAKRLIPEDEMSWYAQYVFHIPTPNLSAFLNGTRSFPAWLAIMMDKAFKTSELLDLMAGAEGRHTLPNDPDQMQPEDLRKVFPLILRKGGHMNADVADALLDGVVDDAEREHLYVHACEMSRYYQDMKERLAPKPAGKAVAS